jgi:hypothetical protein
MSRRLPALGLVLGLILLAVACGSSGGPAAPPGPSPSPLGPPTMTITASGVDPQVLHTFDERETVTFVNADVRSHDVRSDPHPAHTDCPALNLGTLMPGERREIAGPSLPGFTLCYYHDEVDPTNTSFRGVVVTH